MSKILPRPGLQANAQLVFEGKLFEVWQWEQDMFDGSKKIFEKVWRCPTVEIIATTDDHIIIEQQDQPDRKGLISLPSGMADNDDFLAEAQRELLEETGYFSNEWKLLWKQSKQGKIIWDVYYFTAKNCHKIQEPKLDPGEKIEVRLVDFEEFINLTEEPKFRVSPEFINFLLRIQIDKYKKEEFKKLIFKSSI